MLLILNRSLFFSKKEVGKLSRTYVRGRSSYKRTDCRGHCFICGWDKKESMKKKTEKKKYLQQEVYPLMDFYINPDLLLD